MKWHEIVHFIYSFMVINQSLHVLSDRSYKFYSIIIIIMNNDCNKIISYLTIIITISR